MEYIVILYSQNDFMSLVMMHNMKYRGITYGIGLPFFSKKHYEDYKNMATQKNYDLINPT